MIKIKMLGLALGLAFLATQSGGRAAAATCEENCRAGYPRCLVICSKNPCLISCEDQLRFCLRGCGSES